jgi:hypothetical protein
MAYCLVAGVLVVVGASWVLRHMLWIAVPAGVVLAVAAGGLIWWLRGAARRKARYDAAYAAAFARLRAARTVTATAAPQVSEGTQPAVEQHVHYHLHVAGESAARTGSAAIPLPARKEIVP